MDELQVEYQHSDTGVALRLTVREPRGYGQGSSTAKLWWCVSKAIRAKPLAIGLSNRTLAPTSLTGASVYD